MIHHSSFARRREERDLRRIIERSKSETRVFVIKSRRRRRRGNPSFSAQLSQFSSV
jgi:hypothetical protein